MKLLNNLIKQTSTYKHLDMLYMSALDEYEKAENERIEIEKDHDALVDETAEQIKNYIKLLKKIRTKVNKLDRKDKNVKAIKELIKEVL